MPATPRVKTAHLESLQSQIQQENPILGEVVGRVRELDRIARRIGLLAPADSFVTRISWWPLVSVLGTYSAGKSSFINHYLGHDLQKTGNQAVDDKFTVICFGKDGESRVLPGTSLDSDLRFPFYRISTAIEQVASGEGARLDTYIQLKTSPSDKLASKILIDSPGFDADRQRDATLRITEHIVDLSDLVLVFFDARHPEPGAMRDTLKHLVKEVLNRPDANKFVFILNQMDTTARENNPEEVVAAWQRSMAEAGYAGSQFFCIYNPDSCVPIEDERVRENYERKRDEHMRLIYDKLDGVDVARSYRIVRRMDEIARAIGDEAGPRLQRAVTSWRRLVLLLDGSMLLLLLVGLGWFSHSEGYWDGLSFQPPWWDSFRANAWQFYGAQLGVVIVLMLVHGRVRALAKSFVRNRLVEHDGGRFGLDLAAAFDKSVRRMRSVWFRRPSGLSATNADRVQEIAEETDEFVQQLNRHYAP